MKGSHILQEPNETTNIFTNLHHPHPQHPHHHHHQHHHQLNQDYHHHTSEEEESRSSDRAPQTTPTKKPKTSQETHNRGGGDGATIEVVRRPRGRPPGSKNKPKPPIIITRENESAMRPHVLELPSGLDIVEAISTFARKQNIGLCVLTGSGSITNVSLRQPSTTPGPTVTFHGRFDILSISATYLPLTTSAQSQPFNGFTISLAGPQGQIFGGSVVGSLIASGTVFVVVTSFTTPMYHRLPIEDDEENEVEGGPPHQTTSSTAAAAESHPAHPVSPCGVSMSMSMYSCHLPTDVIWAPTARQPPPPPPPF